MTTSPADAMHQALGEFLTEMGRVEFRMLLFVDAMGGLEDPPLEALFPEYAGNSFGPKVAWFKKYCEYYGVPDAQKPALEKVYKDLEELRINRNFIVHGETWDGTFKGKPRQPYRIGIVKDNLDYLDDFEHSQHGPNVFDVEQVRAATKLCTQIITGLADIWASIPASDEHFQEEPDDPSQWPPPTR
jgi:hypothetical protein